MAVMAHPLEDVLDRQIICLNANCFCTSSSLVVHLPGWLEK